MKTKHSIDYLNLLNRTICPGWVAEYRFNPHRRWRFDYCNPAKMIAIEIEGGVFARVPGRHSRGTGFRNDLEKYNSAAILGYRVLRYLPEQMRAGRFATNILEILGAK